jgi:CYTH domain-containing protein
MNAEAAKYSRIEYARRFLVSPDSDWKRFAELYSKRHEDKYLNGTRLRLRIMTDSDSDRQLIKLTKKYESGSSYFRQIITTLLSPDEYRVFDALEGKRVEKIRYYHHYKNRVFSIDVFENELNGLLICETEQPTLEDLMSAEPPPYARIEVTEDESFTGANLAAMTSADLAGKLSAFLTI